MMKFKKTMLLIFVLILVVGLTGCDNWQNGIDEVENATGPSWDMDLSIPLLPATTVNVGERMAEELDNGEDDGNDFIDEEGNFKFSLLGENDGPVIDKVIKIDDIADQTVEFIPGLEGVGFDDLNNVSFDNIDEKIELNESSTNQLIKLDPGEEVNKTAKINVGELSKVKGFNYLEFTEGSIVVDLPEEFILSDDGVVLSFAGEPLDKINDNTFSFDGVQVAKGDLGGLNSDEIELKISFTIIGLDGYDANKSYSADIIVEDNLAWEISIKDYQLNFDLDFSETSLGKSKITFVEGSEIIFEIEGSDLTFADIKLKIADRETDGNGAIDISGMKLQDLADNQIKFSGLLPGDLSNFEIKVNTDNLAWRVKAKNIIEQINDQVETDENGNLFTEVIDISNLEFDGISDYIKPSAGSLEFLLELTSDIEGLRFEFEDFSFNIDGEKVLIDEFTVEAGQVNQLPEAKIDDLFELIFESEDKPETLTVEIGGIKAVDETDEFIIYPGDNGVTANAKMNFYPEFEFVADDEDNEHFIYRAEPEELELDQETRDALKNNLKSVEVVQEIANQLPFVGEIEIFIRENKVDKESFYNDKNEGIYSSGLIDLKKDDQKYLNQEDLDEDFIKTLTETSPVYIGFMIKVPIDEGGTVRFSIDDRIELKMWSNVTVKVNSQN